MLTDIFGRKIGHVALVGVGPGMLQYNKIMRNLKKLPSSSKVSQNIYNLYKIFKIHIVLFQSV